jgi:thiamine pyrophosphate-dependent acetolactate synthase large subunit-like protein
MQQASNRVTQTKAAGARPSAAEYGSDVIVELLQDLGIRYISLNPGSSYRGLHDSIVNFGMSPGPEIILCCHEQIAVAVAGGYARVTGQPMAVGLHDVVGLQNACLGIYSAYCDRSPMLVLGGTGPMDLTKRRPHIDWVHTALVQANQIRDYVKWDDQPSAISSLPESVLRAHRIAMTEPRGPVYLCFDVELQEQPVETPPMIPDVSRFAPPLGPTGSPSALREAASLLVKAQRPIIIPDTMGRNRDTLPLLRELAELLGCGVVDSGSYYNFPSTSPLDLSLAARAAISEADVVLALDVLDLFGAVSAGIGPSSSAVYLDPSATVIHITLGDFLQSKWAADNERLVPVDIPIAADTAQALPELIELCRAEIAADPQVGARIEERRQRVARMHDEAVSQARARAEKDLGARPISSSRIYADLWREIQGTNWSLVGAAGRAPLRALWDFTEPDQRSSTGRSAGIGYSAAAGLGTALAYKDSDRVPICVSGDGSFLMLPSLLWTAANSRLPILYVIYNNRSYGNDEGHQEYMARTRGRSLENKSIGLRLEDPVTDFARVADGFGVKSFGPITDPDALQPALQEAVRTVREQRRPALVDVVVESP